VTFQFLSREFTCQTLILTTYSQRYIHLQALYNKTETLLMELKDHQEIF